jgi:hypothetical protein
MTLSNMLTCSRGSKPPSRTYPRRNLPTRKSQCDTRPSTSAPSPRTQGGLPEAWAPRPSGIQCQMRPQMVWIALRPGTHNRERMPRLPNRIVLSPGTLWHLRQPTPTCPPAKRPPRPPMPSATWCRSKGMWHLLPPADISEGFRPATPPATLSTIQSVVLRGSRRF